MDVECVATGTGHADRSPCIVCIVDYHCKPVLHCTIKPKEPVYNYLTEITGVREGDLDDGEPLEDVIEKVKAQLGVDVILVGQGVQSDITWMTLTEGKDFHSSVDLGGAFGVYNPKFGTTSFFSLEHEAWVLLGLDLCGKGFHDPFDDAEASMELYKRFVQYRHSHTREAYAYALQALVAVPTLSSFAKRNNYSLHGVCMAAFTPSKCTCGNPCLVSVPAVSQEAGTPRKAQELSPPPEQHFL